VHQDKRSPDGPELEAYVTGAIRFPEGTPAFAGATVRVSLFEVTHADAPSRVIVEETIPHASHPGGAGGGLAFALRAATIDARARYVVRVHVDVDNDGRVSQGDYVTTASYPVLTLGHSNRVVAEVRRVGS
jgi:putative lipoprotein